MDFEDSGIDSDPKNQSLEFETIISESKSTPAEPIITFSPDRCRFDKFGGIGETQKSHAESLTELLTSDSSQEPNPNKVNGNSNGNKSVSQKKLEKQIQIAQQTTMVGVIPNNPSVNSNNGNGQRRIRRTPSQQKTIIGSVEDEVEIRSGEGGTSRSLTKGLIPPGRLAIPNKAHQTQSIKDKEKDKNKEGKDQMMNCSTENKPLVQWDSDESEDELSFFPAAKGRAKLTDNMSIDNMSLSGEEDDLHLSPPQQLTRKCPTCDPREWILKTSKPFSRSQPNCIIA